MTRLDDTNRQLGGLAMTVGYMITHPSVRQCARDKGVALYFSNEFDR